MQLVFLPVVFWDNEPVFKELSQFACLSFGAFSPINEAMEIHCV